MEKMINVPYCLQCGEHHGGEYDCRLGMSMVQAIRNSELVMSLYLAKIEKVDFTFGNYNDRNRVYKETKERFTELKAIHDRIATLLATRKTPLARAVADELGLETIELVEPPPFRRV